MRLSASKAPTGRGRAAEPQTERLRYLDAATRQIARGMNLDETVRELCRAAVPAFADTAFVHLYAPLPVDDEPLTAPGVLRLHTADRTPPPATTPSPADTDPVAGSARTTHTGGTPGAANPTDTSRTPGATGSSDTDQTPSAASPTDTNRTTATARPTATARTADATHPTEAPRPSPLAHPTDPLHAVEVVHPSDTGPLTTLLRTGRPVFGNTPGVAPAVAELLGPANARRATASGRRLILAPLHGRSHVMGSVVLVRGPGRRAFTPDDLLVASQLATHTALGIHKAVLYAREASVADALQRTMLPPSLPEPPGVVLASRYLPASRAAQVGGDWYDAIPLPGNRVALVIGDVMGHSMTSAAIMGQLRTIVQTLAGLDLSPDEILHHLDEQAERLGSEHTATCLYAMYDPVLHRLLIANAGHLPPVLLRPDGSTEVLEVPPGAPIGVGGGDFESFEMHAPAGATLLLYTDGLVESRDSDVLTGVELLRERLATAPPAPPALEELCDRALGTLGAGDRDDDIALLAARFEGIRPDTVAYWYLAPRPQTAGQARRLTRRTLRLWDLDSLVESTELMVSEVVANAVRFATRPITLRLLRTNVLRCEVGDDSSVVPRMRHAQLSDEGGRGLFLVDQLSERWGATRVSTGKVVWFEQPLPG
ncbi:SpoIIE family protein phosphatase [Streptomyces sp. NPDC046909]|uniref:SpoIIE family protein phosphatase n=1 Tax=Streptomyces sp. NPDC046909 TaxID=3155617 RepID=UPI0033E86BC6